MWTVEMLLEDARGAGTVFAAFSGRKLAYLDTAQVPSGPISPITHEDAIDGFLGRMYALVGVRQSTKLYRFWDGKKAQPLGVWWCSTRPGLAIDKLGYPSFHNQSRDDLAIKRSWNEMTRVAECTLKAGALAYFGRTAAQGEGTNIYGGGSIQLVVPPTQKHMLTYVGDHSAE